MNRDFLNAAYAEGTRLWDLAERSDGWPPDISLHGTVTHLTWRHHGRVLVFAYSETIRSLAAQDASGPYAGAYPVRDVWRDGVQSLRTAFAWLMGETVHPWEHEKWA